MTNSFTAVDSFTPQTWPLWIGYQEEADCDPVACPVIGWVGNARSGDWVPVIGLGGGGQAVRNALLLELFPSYEAAQRWVDEHPATAEAAARRREAQTPLGGLADIPD